VLAGLPEPTVNVEIRSELGDVLVRFDLAYEIVRVAVEYDGRQHAESPEQYDRDIARREDIDNWDWRIVVITAKGVYADPETTLRRVQAVLVARGLAGVPKRLDPRWRAHFPGRRRTGT
jgi:very-short-patch-repair endonuclease